MSTQIQNILDILPKSLYDTCLLYTSQYLNAWETYAKWRYGIDSEIVFMPNGKAENETKEALHTAGCSLIESTFHIVKTEDKEIVLDNIPEVIGKLERIRCLLYTSIIK